MNFLIIISVQYIGFLIFKNISVFFQVVVPKGIRSLVLNIQNQTSDLTVLGEVTAFTITLETAETGLTMLELQITGNDIINSNISFLSPPFLTYR